MDFLQVFLSDYWQLFVDSYRNYANWLWDQILFRS